ncbi:MAG: hypothetical protein M3Z96_04125 [Pseudomonadota bacterium]|nr:hypothetical protein [Pseudomonadota bacterium]
MQRRRPPGPRLGWSQEPGALASLQPSQFTYGHLEKYSLEAGRSAIEVAAVSV